MPYPPPTLVRTPTSRAAWIRRIVLVGTLLLLGITWAVSNFMAPRQPESLIVGGQGRFEAETANGDSEVALGPIDGNASVPPAAAPEPVATPPVAEAATAPVPTAVAPPAVQRASDSRQASRWYYVPRLGDGPAAIFSSTGGQWDYALACNVARKQIEFIAVRTGDPRGFDGQYLRAGNVRQKLDATYARTAGGTISMTLPASNALFDAISGGQALEAQVVAGSPAVLAANAETTRLVRQCRG